jgi:predicted transposase YbfD/YdcC
MTPLLPPRDRRLARRERQTARQANKGHGRIEQRTLVSTTALNDYLEWPGVQQCFQLTRRRTIGRKTTVEVAFGITSLSRRQANARKLLALVREHWGIENRIFHVRDVTFGEDACRVRTANAPLILSTLRNAALNLLTDAGATNKAAAMRRHAVHPHEALALLKASG